MRVSGLARAALLGGGASAVVVVVASLPGMSRAIMAISYGGITEELMLRYGLMTFLVWVGAKVWVTLPPALCLGVVVFSAVLLGAGHLPAMAALTPLTPLVIMRTVGLNALRGFAFGWLFWRRGLEHVMDAHIATHLSFWAFAAVL
jgi:hypothetical protein